MRMRMCARARACVRVRVSVCLCAYSQVPVVEEPEASRALPGFIPCHMLFNVSYITYNI